jgi:hypothetical protein
MRHDLDAVARIEVHLSRQHDPDLCAALDGMIAVQDEAPLVLPALRVGLDHHEAALPLRNMNLAQIGEVDCKLHPFRFRIDDTQRCTCQDEHAFVFLVGRAVKLCNCNGNITQYSLAR